VSGGRKPEDYEQALSAVVDITMETLRTGKPPVNEDYMSQYPDTDLGRAMRVQAEIAHEYYKEYVFSDHGFERLGCIPRKAAMVLVQESPYRRFLQPFYNIGWDDSRDEGDGIPDHITNKGAVRITPSEGFANRLEDWPLYDESDEDNWHGSRGFMTARHDDRELWVTQHDGRYYLCRPRKEG
jgi:hypothetical protein